MKQLISKNPISKPKIAIVITFTLLIITLFYSIFMYDNKYNSISTFGAYGAINLSENDLSQPIFLIDGWEFANETENINNTNENENEDKDINKETSYTYIGEYSNLQRENSDMPAHGNGTYALSLNYEGTPQEVMVYFPALFFDYEISLDEKVLSSGQGSSQISFSLTEGEHRLLVNTHSTIGYYSGLYHPPVLGSTEEITNMIATRVLVYTLACFVSLALALFTLPIWLQKKDPLNLWFGGLCVAFSMYLSYFFVRQFALPFGEYWYIVQSLAFYGLCFSVLQLMILNCDNKSKYHKWIQLFILGISIILAVLSVFVNTIELHSLLSDIYCIAMFVAVAWLALTQKSHNTEQLYTKLACIAFCAGLLHNLLAINLFEPINTLWHFEWCGLLLVMLFAAAMTSRSKRILAENEAYKTDLETRVAERTSELNNVLQERKAFFADMAHDLKAPVCATNFFIEAIRANATGLDGELLHYIDLVEKQQQEMAQRVQGLNEFNRMDGLSDKPQMIKLSDFLKRIENSYEMMAEIKMIHLKIEPLTTDCTLYAPMSKMDILFENLIFNSLKFTPPDGSITLSACADDEGCHFTLSDTGCGIGLEEIPHLFNRFYVGSKGKEKGGSGLGLYIAKSIVDSLGGEISLSSKANSGTTFFIDLPKI